MHFHRNKSNSFAQTLLGQPTGIVRRELHKEYIERPRRTHSSWPMVSGQSRQKQRYKWSGLDPKPRVHSSLLRVKRYVRRKGGKAIISDVRPTLFIRPIPFPRLSSKIRVSRPRRKEQRPLLTRSFHPQPVSPLLKTIEDPLLLPFDERKHFLNFPPSRILTSLDRYDDTYP